jgi:hypothetical protein
MIHMASHVHINKYVNLGSSMQAASALCLRGILNCKQWSIYMIYRICIRRQDVRASSTAVECTDRQCRREEWDTKGMSNVALLAFSLRRQAMAVSDSDSHAFVQQLYSMSSSTTTDESIGLRSATLETWSHELLVLFQRRLSATYVLPNQILGRLLACLSSSHGC